MNTVTIVTENSMVEVVSLPSDTKSPHELIKEFVANKFETTAYNMCFDRAFEVGLTSGTEAYDECIELILDSLKIEREEVYEMLRSNGVNI